MTKIGFIGPYSGACKLAQALAETREIRLASETCVLEQAIPIAEHFLSDGYYPIISRMPTSKVLIREFGSASIVELSVSNYSFLAALEKAKAFGDYIAFVDVVDSGCNLDIPLMEKSLNIRIACMTMTDATDGERCIRQAKKLGINSIVSTAACLRSVARSYDINIILIEMEEESLSQVIDAAVTISKVKAEAEWFKNYIDSESDAIFSVDRNGIIQIFNPAMCQITELSAEDIIGSSLEQAAKLSPILSYIYQQQHIFEYKNKQYLATDFGVESKRGFEQTFKIIRVENMLARESVVKKRISAGAFQAKHSFSDIIGESDTMRTIIKVARQYAKTNSTILLTGESGVGKEIFAQSIHNESAATGPFVAINCASLPENLIESELYGYEEGSFTGARRGGKLGLFELSNGGTLFLDEIGEIPLTTQAHLLRSIQERQIIRLGGNHVININNRIICATNRSLEAAVQNGSFREDLFYRINILHLDIPPLRERKSDLKLLAHKLAQKYRNNIGMQVSIPDKLLDRLSEYHWPGNVREFESFLERLIVTCDKEVIDVDHFELMFNMLQKHQKPLLKILTPPVGTDDMLHIKIDTLEKMNQQIIQEIYHRENRNASQSSIALGISRATLWRKLRPEQPNKEA